MARSRVSIAQGIDQVRQLHRTRRLHDACRMHIYRYAAANGKGETPMKAFAIRAPGGLDKLEIRDIPDPGQPGPGQIRVALHATSLNFHDLLVVSGKSPTADGRVPMSDGAGVVDAVGDGVTEFAVGDHVVSCFFPQWTDGLPQSEVGNFAGTPGDGIDGMAAMHVVRAATAFTHAPRGWSHAEAATITTAGLTAWRALVVDGGLKAGDTVLVLGTGGVSIAALQIAKTMGAQVIVTSSSDEKLARAKALGADHAVNYRTHEKWGALVRELADGRGVDHVIEVGGPGTLAQSIEAVRVGGHIALIGVLTGREGMVPTSLLMARQAKLQGLIVGSRRHQQEYVRALELNGVRPVIDRTFGFDALPDAFRHQESGAHFGKICVEW
jgi:NADPH:quinone reductase-like Zn-dependent oxidoreductase